MLDQAPRRGLFGIRRYLIFARMDRQGSKRSVRRHRSRLPRRDLAAAFGNRIRSLRTAKKISQAELGAPYFTRAHVSAIELGKILPAIPTLTHFARKLGVSVRELVPPEL